jgi:hypothetical protein
LSKIEFLRRHVMALYREHLEAGMLPTSIRFLFYELVALTIISKQASGVLKPGAVGQRRPDQDVIDAITSLRESGDIRWDDIVDETPSLDDYTGWPTIAAGVNAHLDTMRLDPWGGAAPLILTESRSLAGVAARSDARVPGDDRRHQRSEQGFPAQRRGADDRGRDDRALSR